MDAMISASRVTLPHYIIDLLGELRERSKFKVLHVSRQLDDIDGQILERKFESLALNDQNGSVIDSTRIFLQDSYGVELTLTWGVFEEDLPSADLDFQPKKFIATDSLVYRTCTPTMTATIEALSAACFEVIPGDIANNSALRFIRGRSMVGKMRAGIHAQLDTRGFYLLHGGTKFLE